MFHITARRGLATLAAGAVAALAAGALPAAAADGDPLQLGRLQITPASGQIDAGAKTGWIEAASTGAGEVCPENYRYWSTFEYLASGTRQAAGFAIQQGQAGIAPTVSGLDDADTHIYRTGSYAVTPSQTATFPWGLAAGGATVELRHTCVGSASYGYVESRDYYYAAQLEIAAGGAWHVVAAPTPAAQDSSESDLDFELPPIAATPPPATGLKITVTPGPATLSGPATREPGQVWTAVATLGDVTVNDDRRDAGAAAWTLNGKASDFTAAGQDPISAAYLGWTPA
ncbi:MAG: hypothetical protein LBL01_05540, partial [Bifidobacteriaceae bacterium]|nr:hypothetical protein [Bifidobacteriaceae bacterium]